VSLVLAGTFRVPPDQLKALEPHMRAVIAASRSEDGCLDYSFAVDLDDAGLIRVFEHWRDQACLDAHFQTSHMDAWRQARAEHGFHERRLTAYEVSGVRAV
jgi:quinol monooxygenase YgiN